MGDPTVQSVWELAAKQHSVVTRGQLLMLGYSAKAIKHRVASGRLHLVCRGVYAVGRPQLTRYGRWMAAVLSCGTGAVLSHRSAAALWAIAEEGDEIEVTVPGDRRPRGAGIAVYRRDLPAGALARHRGFPVTGPALTLVDLAACGPRDELEAAVNEADKRDLVTPEQLRAALDEFAGRPGVAALRELLDRRTFRLTDSQLERRFLRLAARAGLPVPLTRQRVNGFRVDFYWPDLGLVVEADGLRYHRTPAAQARDRLRDQTHTAAGLTQLRFTHAQIRYEPGYVAGTLAAVARRL
jgi:very-short-patch-repair endonuclease